MAKQRKLKGNVEAFALLATPDQIEVAGLKGVKSGQVVTVRRESQ
ncbi:hypothetical protein SF83666_a41470 (plasmid) [Sinorhizobium fredii CCBAU 83666]|nr:hypothetical protein SF83666_a41470 [Sinorhizobium fredii CCBAU 83666]